MSKIERRERHIRRIRETLGPLQEEHEEAAHDPRTQYNMGKSQNSPVHVPTFLRQNNGDPATKVGRPQLYMVSIDLMPAILLQNFFRKLRAHLLPRIQEVLNEVPPLEGHPGLRPTLPGTDPEVVNISNTDVDPSEFVFLKNDRIYHHKLTRFHFTAYDVRRGTDIINPGNSRCNIMLLANNADTADCRHHFLYARVIGTYHANVIYTGPGWRDYEARRLDFLWVRWFEVVDPAASGWTRSRLDSVRFPPMDGENAFGFVDPTDVLRGCHVMPKFANGKRHAGGVGISRCAKDGQDYHRYYIGR